MAPVPSESSRPRDAAAPLEPGPARTYYERPWLDRWTGRYTLEWETQEGTQRLRVANRLVDLQGRKPSWGSVLRLPKTVWTWWGTRRNRFLRRPVPFLAWDAIAYLEKCLQPGQQVLEVGGGNSTLWLLEHGVRVHTVEPHGEWIEALGKEIAARYGTEGSARWQGTRAAGSKAVEALRALEPASLDMAIVDPHSQEVQRVAAIEALRDKVRSGGWLVLDNSDHPQNLPAQEILGPPDHVTSGYGAMCLVVTQTAFWRVS